MRRVVGKDPTAPGPGEQRQRRTGGAVEGSGSAARVANQSARTYHPAAPHHNATGKTKQGRGRRGETHASALCPGCALWCADAAPGCSVVENGSDRAQTIRFNCVYLDIYIHYS